MEGDSNLQACPYLGLSSDASISRLVATSAHRCHRWATPQTVEKEHQVNFCLSDNYLNCPWFVHPGSNFSSRQEQYKPVSRKQRVVGVGALLIVFLLLFGAIKMFIWPAFFDGDQGMATGGSPAATATTAVASGGTPAVPAAGQPTPIATASSAQPTMETTHPPTTTQPSTVPVAAQTPVVPATTATRAASTTAVPRSTSTPSPTSRPQVTPSTGEQVYEVQPGDTLYGLARTYGVTVEDIMEANDLTDRGSIRVGQRLIIPPAE